MEFELFSHRQGRELIPRSIVKSVLGTIKESQFNFKRYGTRVFRKEIMSQLQTFGWSDEVRIASTSRITITSMRGNVALCLQTGNMSRFYADLLKLQFLFKEKKAASAIYILPTKNQAKEMGSNLAYFERFTEELELFKDIYEMPTLVIGFE